MSELLKTAKIVCDLYDYTGPLDECEAINRLIAAVERAEKQEVFEFDAWWEGHSFAFLETPSLHAREIWTAAQQAERERVKDVVAELLDTKDPWIHYSTLLDKIDGPDDDSGEE